MIRRGLLRMLAGSAAGAALVRKQAAQQIAMPSPVLGRSGEDSLGLSQSAGMALPVSSSDGKWTRLRELLRPHEGRAHRYRYQLELLGGYPPQIVASHSWSPAFRAMVAARLRQAKVEEADSLEAQLRALVFGEPS